MAVPLKGLYIPSEDIPLRAEQYQLLVYNSVSDIHTILEKRFTSETLDAPSGECDGLGSGDVYCRVRIG